MRYIIYRYIHSGGLVHVLDQFSALCGFNQGSFNFSIQAFQQLSISSFARFFSNFVRYCGLQSFRRSSRKLFCFCTWVFFWSAICLEVRDCGNSHENRQRLNDTLALPVRVIRQQHSVFEVEEFSIRDLLWLKKADLEGPGRTKTAQGI